MKDSDNIVKDAGGQPVVPFGTATPMSEAPKDTLSRPVPPTTMPATQSEVIPTTVQSKAIESMTTYDELAATHGFKSPEDLAKSYKELRSQTSRVEATLAEAMRAREIIETPVPTPEQAETTEDALRIVDSRIQKQVNQIKDAFEYKLHLIEHPEDREYANEAISLVKDNPGIQWGAAFDAARGRNLGRLTQAERERGKQEAYQSIERKSEAQSVHSSQRTIEPSTRDIIDGIKTGRIPLSEARRYINNLSQQS